jgi:hypothetical protein
LLPPGHWEFRAVFDHYRKKSSSSTFDHELDWQRIEQIKLLQPILRHVGVKAWGPRMARRSRRTCNVHARRVLPDGICRSSTSRSSIWNRRN